jgi:myosin-1
MLVRTPAEEMQLYAPENFNYLNQSACYTVDGIDDIKEFADTRNAMNVMGMTAEEQRQVFHLVAGILHLGNVAFHDGGKGTAAVHDENCTHALLSRLFSRYSTHRVVSSGCCLDLNLAASYLRVEPFALKNALLFRVLNTGGAGAKKMSTYNVPQNVEQAASARDALAKTIYSRMFDWIVSKVNEALQKQGGSGDHNNNMIGVLDIFGFEIFEVCGPHSYCLFFRSKLI